MFLRLGHGGMLEMGLWKTNESWIYSVDIAFTKNVNRSSGGGRLRWDHKGAMLSDGVSFYCIPSRKSLTYFFNIYLFWGREHEGGCREKERKKGRIPSRLHAWTRHRAQSHESWDHNLSRNQELNAQPNEPPRCPMEVTNIFKQTTLWLGTKVARTIFY